MNLVAHNFQNALSAEERRKFASRARSLGRRPGAHLKVILFGEPPQAIKHALKTHTIAHHETK